MRMLHFMALVIMCFCSTYLTAQKNKKVRLFRTSIYFNETIPTERGVLYDLSDSLVSLSDSYVMEDYYVNNYRVTHYTIPGIMQINVHKNDDQVLKSIGIGLGFGIVSGH